jgi:hypothetical protein
LDSLKQFTRRNLFVAASAAPLIAIAATGQETPVAAGTASSADDLKTARDLMAAHAALLAKVEVPIATEPAFSFKA